MMDGASPLSTNTSPPFATLEEARLALSRLTEEANSIERNLHLHRKLSPSGDEVGTVGYNDWRLRAVAKRQATEQRRTLVKRDIERLQTESRARSADEDVENMLRSVTFKTLDAIKHFRSELRRREERIETLESQVAELTERLDELRQTRV